MNKYPNEPETNPMQLQRRFSVLFLFSSHVRAASRSHCNLQRRRYIAQLFCLFLWFNNNVWHVQHDMLGFCIRSYTASSTLFTY